MLANEVVLWVMRIIIKLTALSLAFFVGSKSIPTAGAYYKMCAAERRLNQLNTQMLNNSVEGRFLENEPIKIEAKKANVEYQYEAKRWSEELSKWY